MNENENLQPVQKLTPFTKMIMSIGTLPSSFYASMSYYESMVWLYEYLKNQIIPTVNNNGEAVEELQEAYTTLKNYIDTYFDNLDLQEEVNKKLDEMAEDGTITNLIKAYVDPIQEEFEEEVQENIDYLNRKINAALGSTPLVATSTDEMTDTTKIYVNTTDGYWYYYDNGSWLQGGVYQASVNNYQTNLNTTNISTLGNNLNGSFPNLFNNQLETTTVNDITYTVNTDKSININGTASALSYITQNITLPAGKYILKGCNGGSNITYHQAVLLGGNFTYQYDIPIPFTLENETTFAYYIRVLNGVSVSNKVIKPMIYKETNNPDEYVPYGVLYLPENVDNLLHEITGYEAINLLPHASYDREYQGITRTINEDKSITYDGEATGTWRDGYPVSLKAGSYIASGLDKTGSSQTFFLRLVKANNEYIDSNSGVINFTIDSDQEVRLFMCMIQGADIDNVTFYPMIRDAKIYNDTYVPYGLTQIYKPIQQLINYTKFNWSGKKMNALGDSIVYGANGNFINVIGGILNLSVVRNYGVGGSCIASDPDIDGTYPPAVLRYVDMDTDADIILVHAGTNDYTAQIPLGAENSTDIQTFNGALNVLMNGLRSMYPDKLIIFSGILDRIQDNNPERYPIPCSTYRQAIEDRCYANKIVYYDGYRWSGFNFHQDYYDHVNSNDGLHPNQTGANILGRKIAGFINWQ